MNRLILILTAVSFFVTVDLQANFPTCIPEVDAVFSDDDQSVTVSSTKELSNVVLHFSDGSVQKFEKFRKRTYTAVLEGTGSQSGETLIGVWVKSGCNDSGDGPGYGEYITNILDIIPDRHAAGVVSDPSSAATLTCIPEVGAVFSDDDQSVTVTSTKELSNVVLHFSDGSVQKFEKFKKNTYTAVLEGTGSQNGETLIGVWVKSGCNDSGDGPGYGEYIVNILEIIPDRHAAGVVSDPSSAATLTCIPEVGAVFSDDDQSVTVTSTKELSNVVLHFSDGSVQKFEKFKKNTYTAVLEGTGSQNGETLIGVWVKSGCNDSGDGPGYGEYITNILEIIPDRHAAGVVLDPSSAATLTCIPEVGAVFSDDDQSVTVTSTKELSNVVLHFSDGSVQKFEKFRKYTFTATFEGTGSQSGETLIGVWVKSGCNDSGDGPGYGEYITNILEIIPDRHAATNNQAQMPGYPTISVIGGIDLGELPNFLFFFADGSGDANWQGATKGFAGDVAVDGLQAKERTSGGVPFGGTIYTNDSDAGKWEDILEDNSGAHGSYGQSSLISGLEADLDAAFDQIDGLIATPGYADMDAEDLDGLNTRNYIAETYVINITDGMSISSKIYIDGDKGDVFILRWDEDGDPSNGYQGKVKFQSGGGIVPIGDLGPSNFIHVAGEISSSGGGSNPDLPYPQGPRTDNGTGNLIEGGEDFKGGGFFTGYWLTTGKDGDGKNGSLSNAIFVGGWYTKASKFSMTSGTSGVHVAPQVEEQFYPVRIAGDAVSTSEITAYPNPVSASGSVWFKGFQHERAIIRISGLDGRTYAEEMIDASSSFDLARYNLVPGLFMIEVLDGDTRSLTKVMVY